MAQKDLDPRDEAYQLTPEVPEAAEADAAGGAGEAPAAADDAGGKPAGRGRGRKRKEAAAAAEGDSPAKSKIDAAGEATTSRREVLRDARRRETERALAQQLRQKFLSGWGGLNTAMRRGSIVNGVVTGVEVHVVGDGAGGNQQAVMIAVLLGEAGSQYKVLIPFGEFYQKNPIDMKTVDLTTEEGREEYVNRQRAMAQKLYELEIPLIITDMVLNDADGDTSFDYGISGSRRKALDIIERSNFGSENGEPRIKEGDFVTATITSVSIYSVAAVVGGVDTSIPMRALTYRYLSDARTYFKVGQELNVYVSSIKELPDGHHEIEVNAKPAELASAQMRQGMLPIGTSVLGIVTGMRPSTNIDGDLTGNVDIMAYLPMYDMPGIVRSFPPSALGRRPIAGDEVRLRVRGYSQRGYVYLDCTGFNGAPSFLGR